MGTGSRIRAACLLKLCELCPSLTEGPEGFARVRAFLAITERASWSLGSGLVLSSVLASAIGPGLVLPVFGLCPPLALMVAGLALIAVAVCALVCVELVIPGYPELIGRLEMGVFCSLGRVKFDLGKEVGGEVAKLKECGSALEVRVRSLEYRVCSLEQRFAGLPSIDAGPSKSAKSRVSSASPSGPKRSCILM